MAAPYEKEWQPPRPRNPWIIFRTDMLKQRQPRPPGTRPQPQADASKDIAKLWRNLSPEVREEYERRAAEEKVEHERRYPNYKYKPKSKAEKEREREEKKAEKLRKKEEAKRAKQLPPPTFAYGLQVPYYAAAAAMVPGPEDFPSPPISLASPLPDEPTPPSAGPSMIMQASSSSSRNVSQSNSPASSRHTPDSDESVAPRASAYLARKKATRVASGRESEPDLVPEELSWILSQIPGQPQQSAQSYLLGSGADGANVSPVANVEQQVVAPTVPQILTQFTYDHDWTLPTPDASQPEVPSFGMEIPTFSNTWNEEPLSEDPLHALLNGTNVPGIFDISGLNTGEDFRPPVGDFSVALGTSSAAPADETSDPHWLSLFDAFLEKNSGAHNLAPIAPGTSSSSSSDTLLTPPTPQSSTIANDMAMNAFFNFDGDLTALSDQSLPPLPDNYFQPGVQCSNDFSATQAFLEHINPAQLLQPTPVSALSPLEQFSMSTFAQPSAATPSPSSSVPPSSFPSILPSSSAPSSSSSQSYYRPPPGAMNASSRRVAGSWRVPLAFTTHPEEHSRVEVPPLGYHTSMPWGMEPQ